MAEPGKADRPHVEYAEPGPGEHLAQIITIEDVHMGLVGEDRGIAEPSVGRQQKQDPSRSEHPEPVTAGLLVGGEVFHDILRSHNVQRIVCEGKIRSIGANDRNRGELPARVL